MNAANQPESSLDIARIAGPFLETCASLRTLLIAARRSLASSIGGGNRLLDPEGRGTKRVSFRFSSGTMDSMAGVFAPPKKYRMGSGGGSAKGPKAGGTLLGIAMASMFPKPASSSAGSRPSIQGKHAFGGGSQARRNNGAVMAAERT